MVTQGVMAVGAVATLLWGCSGIVVEGTPTDGGQANTGGYHSSWVSGSGGVGPRGSGGAGGDLKYCPTFACGNLCLPDGARCNGFVDCPGGEDESPSYCGSTGGVPNTGGYMNTAGVGPGDPAYTCLGRAPRDPGGAEPFTGLCCSSGIAMLGQCMNPADVANDAMKQLLGHDACPAALLCQPFASGAHGTCRATLGAGLDLEGRCEPKCFVLGSPLAPRLQPDDCSLMDHVCTPCFDPVDGTPTGVCSQDGDSPKEPKPAPYAPCGATDTNVWLGRCVPKSVVDASGPRTPALKQHECATTELCVPMAKARNADACFAKCTVGSTTVTSIVGNDFGGCVPAFVVMDSQPAASGLLLQDSCAVGEQCAPCTDPLASPPGPSGACD